ncbi:hypothetical protein J6590_071956 [Homalodisca vitripennis]|nr:hypothetical protein J6590_071956 [Homalodisca vitripennis]
MEFHAQTCPNNYGTFILDLLTGLAQLNRSFHSDSLTASASYTPSPSYQLLESAVHSVSPAGHWVTLVREKRHSQGLHPTSLPSGASWKD